MNNYYKWLNDKYIDEADKQILKNMKEYEIEESFSFDLEFGTAGIRGIMGLGSSKLNKYTIGKVTVGLANYLNEKSKNPKVVIAYDTRNNSKEFATNAALILNYYGIKTYLFKDVASTPELSFAVKYIHCDAGIVITSSHNAKIYNGYKVYNSLGGQIVPPEDDLIIKHINSVESFEMIKMAPLNNELFDYTSEEMHKAFIEENKKVIINENLIKKHASDIKITYSSLHGVGLKSTEEVFNELGFVNYNVVKEQSTYDGDFPYAPEPNPEYIENYDLAIKYAKENNSDIILLTDPDADRLGVMYKNNNEYQLINGDLLGALFAYYIINNSYIEENSYMIRSIVTSTLIDELAAKKNINVFEVLTGCKNIANKRHIENKKGNKYLFGYEESLGYMFNININDKNGFSSMICMLEILCYCKEKNISLNDYINNIFNEYGYFEKETINFNIKGIDYKEKINNIMKKLRDKKYDLSDKSYFLKDYSIEVGENNTNALKYSYSDGTCVMIRPSGTEPKIKVYIMTHQKTKELSVNTIEKLKEEISKIIGM